MQKIDPSMLNKLVNSLKSRGVVKAYLFGSYARGEQTAQSDIDLLVDYSPELRGFKVLEVEEYVSDDMGMKVDLITRRSARNSFLDFISPDLVEIL
jgi:uncharacterized protein